MKGLSIYRHLLAGAETLDLLTLGEGNTPLVKSRFIGPSLGVENLYFKLESLNPTGSYKDRFAALAISKLVSDAARLCLATSSGNTGASLAAYAALAGLPCHIVVVDGAPVGKLKQMQAYGARLWMAKNFGIDQKVTTNVFDGLREMADSHQTSVQISAYHYSPFGMQGVQTIAYEIAAELLEVDHVFVPAGGGGLTLATARGFSDWSKTNSHFRSPKVHCVQPEGNNTMAGALRNGSSTAEDIPISTTKISGLQVPGVIDGNQVITACRQCDGSGYLVSDFDVFKLQKKMALKEGILCEPAAAVALAGFMQALAEEDCTREETVVCLVTGHGFKDPHTAEEIIKDNPIKYIDELNELKKALNEST